MTHANRGNVAVICWNTLTAPTWYVTSENLDGEVSLGVGTETKSLLEINFSEFTHEDSEAVGKLKEVETTVSDTPARNTEIGDRQIILDNVNDDFDFKSKSEIKKSLREEKTYITDEGIVAYVPEEVYDDIDSLRNKTVTVVFGEDNIVALITVEDDTVEKEFLTKYVVADAEITVGGEKYDLADNYVVKVNDVKVEVEEDDEDALTVALNSILGSFTNKAFDKKIEATLTIDEDEDEVTKIDLFVSGNYDDFKTIETVVKKIKNEKIETVAGNITWDEDDYESKDYPRVYIDGKKAEITDIEAGDVLTILGVTTLSKAEDIDVIYASRETVEGEVTKVKNKTEIYVDGTSYMSSELEAYLLKDNIKDLGSSNLEDNFNSLHGEEVVLHTNVLGEYVLIEGDLVGSDWQFAIVDHIYDVEEDEEDSDLFYQKLRLVMMDGSKVRNFKLVYDADQDYDDDDEVISKATGDENQYPMIGYGLTAGTNGDVNEAPDKAKDGLALTGKVVEDEVIAFKANADGEIELDEVFKITFTTSNIAEDVTNDYDFIALNDGYGANDGEKISYDTKRIDFTEADSTTRYKVTSNTQIINVANKETSTWKKFIDDTSTTKTAAESIIIMEEDQTEISYILILDANVARSDTQYAIVLEAIYTTSRTETSALLLGIDGKEYVYKYDDDDTELVEGSLISYIVSDDEMEDVEMLVDLDEANELDIDNTFDDAGEFDGKYKCAYKVEEVEEDYLVYTDDADNNLDNRFIDINTDDITVIDYRTGEMIEAGYDADTLEGEYVLFFDTDTDEDGYELLVIIAE